jgi:DNA-binding FadR family transcriptional regulator
MANGAPRSLRPGTRPVVTELVKAYIVEQGLQPGDPMPTEQELCDAIGVGRSSIREAIKTLTALDIVEVRHGYGTFVGRLSLSALVNALVFRSRLAPAGELRLLRELVDVRELLDGALADRAIDELDTSVLDELDELVDEMDQRQRRGELFEEQDRRFHEVLSGPLDNELVAQLVTAFWDVYAAVSPQLGFKMSAAAETVVNHRRVVAAARAKDREAFRRAIAEHYRPVRDRIAAATTAAQRERATTAHL